MNAYRLPDGVEGFIGAADENAFLMRHPDAIPAGSTPCECRERRRILRMTGNLNIPADCRDASFAAFDEAEPALREGKEWMRHTAGRMAAGESNFIEGIERPGLVFTGPTGTGKSSMAACIARAWAERGIPVAWRDYTQMYEDIKKTYNDHANATQLFIEALGRVNLLVIDEMGHMGYSEPLRHDQFEKTHMILRLRHEKKLPTVITTNLSGLEFYRRFGDMVGDRIRVICHWIQVSGKNFRFPKE